MRHVLISAIVLATLAGLHAGLVAIGFPDAGAWQVLACGCGGWVAADLARPPFPER